MSMTELCRAPTLHLGDPSPAAPEPSLQGPDLPLRYEVDRELGHGGMARVYEAHDSRMGRKVAIKVAKHSNPTALAGFRLEARITGQLEHPNVLPVYDLGVDGEGVPFFTMKVVQDHRTLADLVDELANGDPELHARFTFQRRAALVQEVGRAVMAAHEVGILHRDIKPSNIVVGPNDEVYLADWGLACTLEEGFGDEEHIVGTPVYMAPEQLRGQAATPRTEVFALTSVLYALMTLRCHLGRVETLSDVQAAHERPVVWADRFTNPVSGRVPRALARICAKGLALNPQERYATVAELLADLQRWQDGRAQVFCAGTFLQRALGAWSRQIDEHTYLGPLVSYAALALLAGCVVRVVRTLA